MSPALQPFPARLDALSEVLAGIDDYRNSIDSDTLNRVRVAVEELFTNSIQHGYPEDGDFKVWIGMHCDSGRMRVLYEDSAAAFDPFAGLEGAIDRLDVPLEQRSTGSLGCLLIRQLADSASYSRYEGRNRIELVFSTRPSFRLSPE